MRSGSTSQRPTLSTSGWLLNRSANAPPKAPSPTNGFLLYVPEEELIAVDMPVEAALKLVISGGLLGAEKFGNDRMPPTPTRHWKWTDIFKRKSGRMNPAEHLNDPRD